MDINTGSRLAGVGPEVWWGQSQPGKPCPWGPVCSPISFQAHKKTEAQRGRGRGWPQVTWAARVRGGLGHRLLALRRGCSSCHFLPPHKSLSPRPGGQTGHAQFEQEQDIKFITQTSTDKRLLCICWVYWGSQILIGERVLWLKFRTQLTMSASHSVGPPAHPAE